LPSGPWLTELKRQVAAGAPADTPLVVAWHDRHGAHERAHTVGELAHELLTSGRGEKIVYVTDVVHSETNVERIATLAAGADRLFIECVFLDEDGDHAARKFHLTARQAGLIARRAGAACAIPFHFSPRYMERERELRAELREAHTGVAPAEDRP
jgi:ribonuclease Z